MASTYITTRTVEAAGLALKLFGNVPGLGIPRRCAPGARPAGPGPHRFADLDARLHAAVRMRDMSPRTETKIQSVGFLRYDTCDLQNV